MKMYRQGDVLLVEVSRFPVQVDDFSPKKEKLETRVVAEGEVTGHNHQVVGEAEVYRIGWRDLYANVSGPATLVHQEHGAIPVDPGIYRVVIQQEYGGERSQRRIVRD